MKWIFIVILSCVTCQILAQTIQRSPTPSFVASKWGNSSVYTITAQLDSGKIVRKSTLQEAIYSLTTIEEKQRFIEILLKYDHWEAEMKLYLLMEKVSYHSNAATKFNNLAIDSANITTLLLDKSLQTKVYNEMLISYIDWHMRLIHAYETSNKYKEADEACISILRIPPYEIVDDRTRNAINEARIVAIQKRLQYARGNAHRLKNIYIPYPLEDEALFLYKKYMEELEEKIPEPQKYNIRIKGQ